MPRVTRTRLSVAVVQGGPSSEAEVSRASAKSVARALEAAGHAVVRLELDAFLAESLRTGAYDVVFPAVHGAVGEDGSLQGLLEVLEIPYVGSSVLASALAMDKRLARHVFELEGLPVAKGIAARRADASDARAASAEAVAARALVEIGARLVVKPASSGSAIGVARIEADAKASDVTRAIEAAWELDDVAIIEHFAKGREVTCGVIDIAGADALPPTEILAPSDPFYTFEARYAPGRSRHVCPADLSPGVFARVQEIAVRACAPRARVPRFVARRLRRRRRRRRVADISPRSEHASGLHRHEPLSRSRRDRGARHASALRRARAPRARTRPHTSQRAQASALLTGFIGARAASPAPGLAVARRARARAGHEPTRGAG